jgi:hypothetical protein
MMHVDRLVGVWQRKCVRAARWLLLPWGASTLLVGSVLMAGHWVVLPVPDRSDVRLERAIGELDSAQGTGGWQMVHVLYTECRRRCASRRIFRCCSCPAMSRWPFDRTQELPVLLEPFTPAQLMGAVGRALSQGRGVALPPTLQDAGR